MTRTEFAAALKGVTTRGQFSARKAASLPTERRHAMAHYIIRNRGPVVAELADGLDPAWLACMGYLHRTTGPASGLTFVHTAAHTIS